MFGVNGFGAPYFGQAWTTEGDIIQIRPTADVIVRMMADDYVVRIPADDYVVQIPADDGSVML